MILFIIFIYCTSFGSQKIIFCFPNCLLTLRTALIKFMIFSLLSILNGCDKCKLHQTLNYLLLCFSTYFSFPLSSLFLFSLPCFYFFLSIIFFFFSLLLILDHPCWLCSGTIFDGAQRHHTMECQVSNPGG